MGTIMRGGGVSEARSHNRDMGPPLSGAPLWVTWSPPLNCNHSSRPSEKRRDPLSLSLSTSLSHVVAFQRENLRKGGVRRAERFLPFCPGNTRARGKKSKKKQVHPWMGLLVAWRVGRCGMDRDNFREENF